MLPICTMGVGAYAFCGGGAGFGNFDSNTVVDVVGEARRVVEVGAKVVDDPYVTGESSMLAFFEFELESLCITAAVVNPAASTMPTALAKAIHRFFVTDAPS